MGIPGQGIIRKPSRFTLRVMRDSSGRAHGAWRTAQTDAGRASRQPVFLRAIRVWSPMISRPTLFVLSATLIVAGALLMLQASRLTLAYAMVERLRAEQVAGVAGQFADTLLPVRRLAELGSFIEPGWESDRLMRAVTAAEAGSPSLRRFAVYSPDGRLITATNPDTPANRPELLGFAVSTDAQIGIGRFRRDATNIEVVAVARDLPVAQRLVVVAESALAVPSQARPSQTAWALVLQGNEAVRLPSGLVSPALASEELHWLFSPVGDLVLGVTQPRQVYLAPIPGSDAAIRAEVLGPAPNATATGALTIGLVLISGGVGLSGLLLLRSLRDLTELKASRGTEENLQRILGAIAQDARTPLNSIYGFATLLTETELQSDQAEWASRIQSASQSLTMLLDSLVEIGERSPEEIDVANSIVRPDLIIRDVISLFETTYHDHGIEVYVKIHPSLFEYFEIDERKFRRILYHVIHNAVRYTKHGEVVVHARVEDGSTGEKILVVDVEDTGPGVAASDRQIIFEKFRRGGTKRISAEGLGLGLFVARTLARRLGGDVRHRDRQGGGSVFTISIATRQSPVLPTSRALRGRTALLVGFEPAQRARLAATLHRLGLIAETAPDGFVGLGTAERMMVTRGSLDVIFLDDTLTGMPPEVFVRRLRSIDLFRELPVVLVLRKGRETQSDVVQFTTAIPDDLPVPGIEQVLLRVFHVAQDVPGASRRVSARVLIVEDNHVNRTLFVEILKRAGHSVFTAADAHAALNMLDRLTVDIIVLDIALPVIDGIELAARLKANARTRTIPLIAVTAHEDSETLDAAREAGVVGILTKPIDGQKLARLVEDTLKRERMSIPADGSSPLDDELLINPSYLEAMFLDIGPAKTRDALEEFVQSASRDIPRLTETLASGVLPSDATPMQWLREAAENLGVVQMEGELEDLLQALGMGDAKAAAPHAEALERLWPATRLALLRTLARLEQRYERRNS